LIYCFNFIGDSDITLEGSNHKGIDFKIEVNYSVSSQAASNINFADQIRFPKDSTCCRCHALNLIFIGCPGIFIMEGGYAVDEIGINRVNLLSGFLNE